MIRMRSRFVPLLVISLIALVLVSGCIGQEATGMDAEEALANEQPAGPIEEEVPFEEPILEEEEPAAPSEEKPVTIKDFAFQPAELTIKVGDTVTWTNEDSAIHTATGDGFDSGNLGKGETFSHTFNEIGTFDYICTIHPYMKGKVVVE